MAASNLYSAAADLGLGDGQQLHDQMADSEEERKKKLLRLTQSRLTDNLSASAMLLGPTSLLRA